MSSSSEDSADEDYVPAGVEESDVSDSSGESEAETGSVGTALVTSTKRKKATRNVRSTRTRKPESSSSESDQEVDGDVSSRADEIWKGFKEDATSLVARKRVDVPAVADAAATASSVVKTSGETTATSGDLSSTTSSTRSTAVASAAVPPSAAAASSAEAKSPSTEQRAEAPRAVAAASALSSRIGASMPLSAGSGGASSLESRLKPKLGLSASSVLDSSSDRAMGMQGRLSAGLGGSSRPGAGAKAGGSAALAALMGKADGKKSGPSTLEKSHSDWHSFKSTSGLGEDMKQHNKDGYLEKQDFLKRAELREWEKERTIRTGKPR